MPQHPAPAAALVHHVQAVAVVLQNEGHVLGPTAPEAGLYLCHQLQVVLTARAPSERGRNGPSVGFAAQLGCRVRGQAGQGVTAQSPGIGRGLDHAHPGVVGVARRGLKQCPAHPPALEVGVDEQHGQTPEILAPNGLGHPHHLVAPLAGHRHPSPGSVTLDEAGVRLAASLLLGG